MKRMWIALALVLSPRVAMAGPVPGRWEKVELLSPGAAIVVETFQGDRIEGSYKALTNRSLVLMDVGGTARDLPRDAIRKVSAPRRQSGRFWTPTKVGLLVGFAIGAGIGFAAGDDGVFEDFSAPFNGMVLGGIGATGGALTGYLVKEAGDKPEVLYRAR